VTLALRVLAAPDHAELAPGNVVRLPHAGVDEHGVFGPRTLSLGEVVEVARVSFALVDALAMFDEQYSYGQILIYDDGAGIVGEWSERHFNQGFVRSDGHLSLRTLPESGSVLVRVFMSPYVAVQDDARVIAVPFRAISGAIHVIAPDRVNTKPPAIRLPPGEYRLVTCQRFFAGDGVMGDQDLDLFFERVDLPRQRSEILVADPGLRPELPLLETADPS
jgi:hypothetical protein